MKQIKRLFLQFKWIFITTPVLIGVGVLFVLLISARTSVNVSYMVPVDGGQISSQGNIEVEFDQPMKHDSAQAAFRIEPGLKGNFKWEGNVMSFTTQSTFQPGVTYRISILQGAQALDGRVLKKDVTWKITIRGPEIAYLSLVQNGESGDIWRISANGGQPVQITESGGKVRDFAVSKDGEFLVYSVDNTQAGDDLWVTARDGSGERRLVDCGEEQCMQAVWSMDGKRIAYSRSSRGTAPGNMGGTTRVWLVDAASGQTVLLYQDTAIQGTDPSWSPDSKRLAVFDPNARSIRVLDLETNKEVLLPTGLGQVGGWSPDGQQMIYNDIQSVAGLPSVIVYLVDLNNNRVTPILGQDLKGEDYSIADWSPDGLWIAIGVGNTSGAGGKQIEIMKPDGSSPTQVTKDLTYAHASYHWDPSGKELVFQRLQTAQASNGPEIVIWQAGTGQSQVLVENAALPEWMP